MTLRRVFALALTGALLFGACGSDDDDETTSSETSAADAEQTSAADAEQTSAADADAEQTSAAGDNEAAATGLSAPDLPMATEVGEGEGELNIIAWAGYTEDDWVKPFEEATSCKVNVKVGNTSDEMVQLMKTGQYDGVSASGDATLRLIAAGDVAPVNTDLIPNYADVFDGLKNKPWNSLNGKAYGVPHGRGANLLMYRTDKVTPAPDSWSVVWEADSAQKGSVTAYDSPIYIADAAVYLMATQPDLGITNPYALDDEQFAAAVDLLKQQKTLVGEYWSDYTKEVEAFKSGSSTVGTTWQVIANVLKGESAPIEVVLPKEGSTGWSDTWMISAKAEHPNCMYKWMDHIISPAANAQAAEYFGEAPANSKACAQTADPAHCDTFHASDEAYFDQVWYWTTPTKTCLDGRGDKCVPYDQWVQAWTEIKG
jgi:putative spermidine/putrescine transport system substrate-binding protein